MKPELLEGVAKAVVKLDALLTEVESAMQTFRKNEGVAHDLVAATKKLNVVLIKADRTLDSIENGEGTLGKLIKNE